MQIDYTKAQKILEKSTVLYTEEVVEKAIAKIAKKIDEEIKDDIPLFLIVMNGGAFFATKVMSGLKNPIMCDYIHATRYGMSQVGGAELNWIFKPDAAKIKGKTVYVLDDVLDEGHTLAEITKWLMSCGAKACKNVVLIDKEIGKIKPIKADHVALSAPNSFLFGCGMDIFDLYRNVPSIYIYRT